MRLFVSFSSSLQVMTCLLCVLLILLLMLPVYYCVSRVPSFVLCLDAVAMAEEQYFADARWDPASSWYRLACAARVRLKHRLISANLADATGMAAAYDTITCESCAAVQMCGYPRIMPCGNPYTSTAAASAVDGVGCSILPASPTLAMPSATAQSVIFARYTDPYSLVSEHNVDASGPSTLCTQDEMGSTLHICSHCTSRGSSEVSKLKNVIEHAITEIHWHAAKMQELCENRVSNNDLIQGSQYNDMLDKFEIFSKMLQRLHLYCQDAVDAPPDVALAQEKP